MSLGVYIWCFVFIVRSRLCNLCLQHVNLSPILFTMASVLFLQQIDCMGFSFQGLCFYLFCVFNFHLFCLFPLFPGGRLSGDGEHGPDNGDSVQPSLWDGYSQRQPRCCLQRAAVGTKESGDRDTLDSSQLDSLLRDILTVKGEKGSALTKICRFSIFLKKYLPGTVLGSKSGIKQCMAAVSPYLNCIELKISFCLGSGWI